VIVALCIPATGVHASQSGWGSRSTSSRSGSRSGRGSRSGSRSGRGSRSGSRSGRGSPSEGNGGDLQSPNSNSVPPSSNSTSKLLIDQYEHRIVGGSDADIGEYPYFVSLQNSGCGGVLVASEWVLTAIHCQDFTDKDLWVGAYERLSTAEGAQIRTCKYYKRDPAFQYRGDIENPSGPFLYDVALCKLDKPVYVDESRVQLRLNTVQNYPSAGTDVVAIGMGMMSSGGWQSRFVRDVTVRVDSNSDCANAPSSAYNSQSTSPPIICASVYGGGKDACQGDSGGPLVRKGYINGKRVDFHVGITSWGVGCADSRFPGVYSRTAYSTDFIRKTICVEGQSRHPFCQTPIDCQSDQEKLVIRVVPDQDNTEWTLTLDGNVVRSADSNKKDFTYEDTICLEKGSIYNFVINDGSNNGESRSEYGFYSLTLDDNEIKRETNYRDQDVTDITTETLPTESPTEPPTVSPTEQPTQWPSNSPTAPPTTSPSEIPTVSEQPSERPSESPSELPTVSERPSEIPTASQRPTTSTRPSLNPSLNPTGRGVCVDKDNYQFRNIEGESCKKLFKGKRRKKKRAKQCNKLDTQNGGNRVKVYCPSMCKKKCRKKNDK